MELDFQKVGQKVGGKWLIHVTKHHKDNQLQGLELSCTIHSINSNHDIKESNGNMFNSIFKGYVLGGNIQEDEHLHNQDSSYYP